MTTGDNAKKALVDALNGVLADHFALYIKTKHFHWHVGGPRFHDLHLLFDQHATELLGVTDLIAERVRKNGADTLTSIGSIGARSRITDQDSTALSAEAMIQELLGDNQTLVSGLKALKEAAGNARDNATDGMVDDWTDQAEQRVWFLGQLLR